MTHSDETSQNEYQPSTEQLETSLRDLITASRTSLEVSKERAKSLRSKLAPKINQPSLTTEDIEATSCFHDSVSPMSSSDVIPCEMQSRVPRDVVTIEREEELADLVIHQTNCSRNEAVETLRRNKYNVIQTILDIAR